MPTQLRSYNPSKFPKKKAHIGLSDLFVLFVCFIETEAPSLGRGRSAVGADAVDAPSDNALGPLGHGLEGQALLEALDDTGDGGLDTLDALFDGRGEEGDVLLPSRRPLGGLVGEALLGAGHDHVERGEDADAGSAEEEDLGAASAGEARDSGGHCVGVCV